MNVTLRSHVPEFGGENLTATARPDPGTLKCGRSEAAVTDNVWFLNVML